MQIAYKEALETEVWLDLLTRVSALSSSESISIQADCSEVIRLLTALTKRVALPTPKDG